MLHQVIEAIYNHPAYKQAGTQVPNNGDGADNKHKAQAAG